jgi:hypothetical protein
MGAEGGGMRYKVNARCTRCGRSFSYWSDDDPAAKVCPIPHALTEAELVAMPRRELRCFVCNVAEGERHNRQKHDEYDNARMGIG